MKNHANISLFLALTISVFSACKQQAALETLQTNSASISYQTGDNAPGEWNVMPEKSLDILNVDCDSADIRVVFKSDVDSAVFTVNEGDTIDFYVVLNKQDSALTRLIGQSKNVNFSDAYIQANQGKRLVEIPEVHELANIVVAISKIGRLDSNMIDRSTTYHQEVLEHFSAYADHPLLDTVNNHITEALEMSSYIYYYGLKMSACAYRFDEKGSIVNEGIVRRMGFGGTDLIPDLKELLEDFARKSDFSAFYQGHENYYKELIQRYHRLNPMDKMQQWLEGKFNKEYGSYRVIFSPLVGGAHSTERFEDNGFTQTVMFVNRADSAPGYSEDVQEMLASRAVFTEIDHNFVNPVTDGFKTKVDELFAERGTWVDDQKPGTAAYSSPYTVFNEYMTWAVFSLYCADTFPSDANRVYQPMLVKQMEHDRGFIRFGEFNNKLIEIYQQNPQADVKEWYRQVLEWLETE